MIADPGVHFRYEADTHTYWLGDEKLLHPTGVLARWTNFDAIPPEKLFIAREFGKSVHEYIAAFNKQELDLDDLPVVEGEYDMGAIVRGYDEQVYQKLMLTPHLIETPIMHSKERYGCTPDMASGSTIFDYKPMSQRGKKLVGVQLAANAWAAIANELIDPDKVKLCSLHYDSWGKWAIEWWDYPSNLYKWKLALAAEREFGADAPMRTK